MKPLVLQLHITSRCNLKCTHCYQPGIATQDMPLERVLKVLNQYEMLLARLNVKGHINLTGGEPFVHPEIWPILEALHSKSERFSFALLTNGSFINHDSALKLKHLNPRFVQVSLDGSKRIHDMIRGKDHYKAVLSALKALKTADISTSVSFTAHKGNYKTYSSVAREMRKIGGIYLWTDRMVPIGSGADHPNLSMTPEDVLAFFSIVHKEHQKYRVNKMTQTKIALGRSLQFLFSGQTPYQCGAGNSLITVMETGEIIPCRRMPIPCGDIDSSTLEAVYFNEPTFISLRSPIPPEECQFCRHSHSCKGGAKCIAYAVKSSFHSKDPGCPIHLTLPGLKP